MNISYEKYKIKFSKPLIGHLGMHCTKTRDELLKKNIIPEAFLTSTTVEDSIDFNNMDSATRHTSPLRILNVPINVAS